MRPLARALVLAAVAFLAGAAATTLWYWHAPAFVLDLERDLPPNVSGVFPVERAAGVPFAWTTERVELRLSGADRAVAWRCAIRARGARPPGVPRADLAIAVDGVTLFHRALANDVVEEIAVTIPAQPTALGLTATFAVSPPFQPGPADRRRLGIEMTALSCVPDGVPQAPARAWLSGAAATAAFAGALGLTGLSLMWAAVLLVPLVTAAGFVLASGAAPYSGFPSTAVGVALWTGLAMVLGIWCLDRRGRPLSPASRLAVGLSATLFVIEALALLHPSKTLVDALFHAHRLEWVLEGRLLFTQPMPSGVQFPYAIALYVVAAPWTLLASNHVALLKIVVLASRALAGLALYPMVSRAWQDRAAGVLAVLLAHVVPLPFVVIGNANLTYAFGQSVAAMTMAAAVFVGGGHDRWRGALALWALASLAFLSHVGLFPVLAALLLAAAAGYGMFGGRRLRRAAVVVAAAALLAALFSVLVYYGRFGDAYRSLGQVRARPGVEAPAAGSPGGVAPRGAAYGVGERAESAARLAGRSFGWPVLALATAGLVIRLRTGWRDPLGIVVAATLGAAVAFEAGSVLAPVAPSFWRYAAEFISRVNFVALPAVVALAAHAVRMGWTRGGSARILAALATALAVMQGATRWLDWVS